MPPTLGTILVMVFWRFAVVPAIVLGLVMGFRKIPSTTACLQDPVFVSRFNMEAAYRLTPSHSS